MRNQIVGLDCKSLIPRSGQETDNQFPYIDYGGAVWISRDNHRCRIRPFYQEGGIR
jgi:hypothetical protein